jgi:two-component system chemotaxis response regulator CheY
MATQPGTLLIVEDFLLMRQIIKGFLRRMGYAHLLEAEDGAEALRHLQRQPVDLVLADWTLPQMDGLALLTAMRADTQWRTVPCLMITAEASRDNVMAAIQAGANGYIVKPFTRETFVAKVTAMMSRMPATSA